MCVLLVQSCLTLCNPLDSSLPDSSVHGVLQARILEWVAMHSFRWYSQSRDWTCVSYVSCIGRQVLYQKCHLDKHHQIEPTYIRIWTVLGSPTLTAVWSLNWERIWGLLFIIPGHKPVSSSGLARPSAPYDPQALRGSKTHSFSCLKCHLTSW